MPSRARRQRSAVAKIKAAEEQLARDKPQPTRIDRVGRQGWLYPDGSVIWDDGEKEVPTSGLSDEHKRAMARAEVDGGNVTPQKVGPTREEIAALGLEASPLAEPEAALARRRAAAKDAASKKPGSQSEGVHPIPPSRDEVESDLRRKARRLLEREIDRLEELKDLAIAGQLELWLDGVKVTRNNPPMQLHNAVLEAIRVSDTGRPAAMVKILHDLAGWQGAAPTVEDTLPYPPPDGLSGPIDLPVNDAQQPAGTGAIGSGGKSPLPVPEPPAAQRTGTPGKADSFE